MLTMTRTMLVAATLVAGPAIAAFAQGAGAGAGGGAGGGSANGTMGTGSTGSVGSTSSNPMAGGPLSGNAGSMNSSSSVQGNGRAYANSPTTNPDTMPAYRTTPPVGTNLGTSTDPGTAGSLSGGIPGTPATGGTASGSSH